MAVVVVVVVAVLLGFAGVAMNERNEPNGSLLYQCCSWAQLVGDVMNWMSWAVLQW